MILNYDIIIVFKRQCQTNQTPSPELTLWSCQLDTLLVCHLDSHICATLGRYCFQWNCQISSATGTICTWQRVETAPGRLFLSRTSATHLEKSKDVYDHPPLGDDDEVDGDGDHLLLGDSDGSERCGGSSFPDHCVATRHCQGWVPAVDGNGEVERSDYAWQFIFSPIGNKIGLTDHSKWVPVLNQGVAWPLTGNHLVCDFTFRHCRLPPTLPLNILDRPTA